MKIDISDDQFWDHLNSTASQILEDWRRRAEVSIKREKAEAEERLGIKVGQTEITCKACEKPRSTFHDCAGMSPERRAEVERLRAELDRPSSMRTLSEGQEELKIKFGMSKEEALEQFRLRRETSKTCQRCEGEKLIDFCPIHLVCAEADNEQRDVEGHDNRRRAIEAYEPETLRACIPEGRKRASLR